MTCRDVIANGHTYRFCPDDPIPAADRMRAVIYGRFLDELTGKEISADLSISTKVLGLSPRMAFGGIAGLVGNPGRLFPGLAGGGTVDLDMTVSANRYVTRRIAETLGPVPGFPTAFQPLDLRDIPMHRQAVALRGRVTQNNTTPRTPLAGVTVRVEGIWSVFPAADVDPKAVIETPNLVSIQPGLYAPRGAGTDVMSQPDMVLATGQEKTLQLPAVSGDTTIKISNSIDLMPGHVLAIEAAHPDLAEYIGIGAIDPASTPEQPALVTLNYPIAHDHAEDAEVVRATLLAADGHKIIRDGIPGDRSVFLDGLTDLAVETVVEIAGSGNPEYQSIAFYQTESEGDDAVGYFRLPPISRVAQFSLRAERADFPEPVTMLISPNYDQFENRRDIVFP